MAQKLYPCYSCNQVHFEKNDTQVEYGNDHDYSQGKKDQKTKSIEERIKLMVGSLDKERFDFMVKLLKWKVINITRSVSNTRGGTCIN